MATMTAPQLISSKRREITERMLTESCGESRKQLFFNVERCDFSASGTGTNKSCISSAGTSTRALISPWNQAWRKHKHKCKHKHKVQRFFLCFRLSLHLLALRKNGAEQKLTPSVRFVQRKTIVPDSALSAGFHGPLKWQSVDARSLTKGLQKWYTITADCLTRNAMISRTKTKNYKPEPWKKWRPKWAWRKLKFNVK